MHFPDSVLVTDQKINLSDMTRSQKEYCVTLAESISALYTKSGRARMVFGFTGPSGAGKSTLAGILRDLLVHESFRAEQLSIDAYHYTNKELGEMGLISQKGRYDTYMVERLKNDLSIFRAGNAVRFPEYSRKTHEPTDGSGSCWDEGQGGILLIEGLWLLYEGSGWKGVNTLLDVSYFIDEDPVVAERRTVNRHLRGGRTRESAESFYKESDAENSREVERTSVFADHILRFPQD